MGEALDGWEDLVAPSKSGGDSISMLAKVKVDGLTWLDISFSKSLTTRFSHPTACRARAGVGENRGKIRIWFDADGPTRVRQMGKLGFMRMVLPAPSWFEPGVREKAPVAFEEVGDGSITLAIPPTRPARPAPPKPAAAPSGGGANEPVDVAETLSGHDVRKLAGGRWQIDGDVCLPTAVVAMVNKRRARSGLPAVRETQLV